MQEPEASPAPKAERLPRYRTGDDGLDRHLVEILDEAGITANRDVLFEILVSAVRLANDNADRLDLKITNAALKEMRYAFRVFAPYNDVPKVTMFGSARTLPEDPLYAQARTVAAELAAAGWMVVTGAGPGIMAAGLEGAGRDMSFGINIRLPFEQGANEFIAADPKLIEMKYFFTRKLMLMKESAGFVVLPGGFGTLDESFELLTLLQTGKADPAPIVFLEVKGGSYWRAWEQFLVTEVASRGLIGHEDLVLYRITDDGAVATAEMLDFYRNYHSRRFVGEKMVIRLRYAPTDADLARMNEEYADITLSGGIRRADPFPTEVAGNDHTDLPRLVLRFDRASHGRLRSLIDDLNRQAPPSAPAAPPTSSG